MKIIVKKSTELSQEEFSQISSLFETVFKKQCPVDFLHRQYENNPFGYAWVSLLIDEGHIVGVNSYVPAWYFVKGEKKIFVNSINSMIKKSYRDFFNFSDMIKEAYKTMALNGVAFVYGYPNDISFPILTKGKLMKPIGEMRVYCLPYRIGGIKTSLRAFNILSKTCARAFSMVSSLFASTLVYQPLIKKDINSYNESRYLRGDALYDHAYLGNGELHFKIMNHEGVRTAFIIDIDIKSSKNFNKAIRFLLNKHSREFDLILYPGWLPFRNTGMIRLPKKLEPKKFHLTGKSLVKGEDIPEEIWEIKNWDTNLSNYDLL